MVFHRVAAGDRERKEIIRSHLTLYFGLGSRFMVGTECRPELRVPANRLIMVDEEYGV